jgi:polyisoprenoid-binding protein YceI
MKKIILSMMIMFGLTTSVAAAQKSGCILAQKGKVTVAWMAYKTPAKKAVSGVFESVKYTAVAKEGKNFREILVGSSVVIDTKSVNSKNKGRDAKLVKFFFEQMSGNTIDAKIVDIKADKKIKSKPRTGVVTLDITMNGVTKRVPMKYSFANSVFSAKGTIDVFDFSANKALASINKACFDLHQGKTWNDVTIAFTTHIEAVLCNVKPLK